MTNNEILRAHLLDIIFDNRNKDYGAYALRREYNQRLLVAISIAMSIILLFVLMTSMKSSGDHAGLIIKPEEDSVRIIELVTKKDKPIIPPPVREPSRVQPAGQVATEKFTSIINIKPDSMAIETPPAFTDLKNAIPSDQDLGGKKPDGIPTVMNKPVGNGNETPPVKEVRSSEFIPEEGNPRFPGGVEALQAFFARNLVVPDELEAGDKKTVQIRFMIDKDGTINSLEIVKSVGTEYDREVIRVCRKMPRWEPAVQNGTHVSVTYVLPVTFLGAEQ